MYSVPKRKKKYFFFLNILKKKKNKAKHRFVERTCRPTETFSYRGALPCLKKIYVEKYNLRIYGGDTRESSK